MTNAVVGVVPLASHRTRPAAAFAFVSMGYGERAARARLEVQ